jgi:hypothetical protein
MNKNRMVNSRKIDDVVILPSLESLYRDFRGGFFALPNDLMLSER